MRTIPYTKAKAKAKTEGIITTTSEQEFLFKV